MARAATVADGVMGSGYMTSTWPLHAAWLIQLGSIQNTELDLLKQICRSPVYRGIGSSGPRQEV